VEARICPLGLNLRTRGEGDEGIAGIELAVAIEQFGNEGCGGEGNIRQGHREKTTTCPTQRMSNIVALLDGCA
jgi:hypothetical protein